MVLRPIEPADEPLLRQIYADAIESQAPRLYSQQQVQVWQSLAWLPGVLDRTFAEGSGWISGGDAAFAIRHPEDRLALLYCRGKAARQGHGKALLARIEADALALLERQGWSVVAPETILIAGVRFERYRMHKALCKLRS